MQLTNNKIMITGATDGIGKALTEKFIELGNEVIGVGRNNQKLNELAENYPQFIPLRADLSKHEELERIAMFIKNEHPDLNVLINNAGVQYNYLFAEELHVLNKIEHEVAVNLLAPLKLTALLLPTLKLNKHSAIVNVSSGLGLVPKMSAPVYCGTKAGLHIYTQALRHQLKQVKVFEIIPPLVDTTMTTGRGKGKISTARLVDEFINSYRNNRYEISIGKVKLLKAIHRISPSLAALIMKDR
ncbi:MAG: SDR family NAD(P)-dependent oxidoreductase [Bacteroidia bacterium]|jgi:short-subunit dehydrogenase involved in D-alanine esterification of teichoic acids|nr:SDR family NAD(P)-dependent oxidoreductase [Bacteroidia bacterium]